MFTITKIFRSELEDTQPVFILFYLLVIKYNDPAVKTWSG
jgi:hypothetical protein